MTPVLKLQKIQKANKDGLRYVSKKETGGKRPANAVKDTPNGWYVQAGGKGSRRSKEDGSSKDGSEPKDPKSQGAGQQDVLEPTVKEEVNVPEATSVKEEPPEITAQSGLGSPSTGGEAEKSPEEQGAEFLQRIKEAVAKNGPDSLSPEDHLAVAEVARTLGDKEMEDTHSSYAKQASEKQSKENAVEAVQEANSKETKAEKQDKSEAKAKAKKAAFDKADQYLAKYRDQLPEGSKERKLIEEYQAVLAEARNDESAVAGHDLKSALNVIAKTRSQLATASTDLEKKTAKKIDKYLSHQVNLEDTRERIANEIDNIVDPVKRKQLEVHLDRLELQSKKSPDDLKPSDVADLRNADSAIRRFSEQNHKDKQKLEDQSKADSEKAKKQNQRDTDRKASEAERQAKTAARTAKEQKAADFKQEKHSKDLEATKQGIQDLLSKEGKHIDKNEFKKLWEAHRKLDTGDGTFTPQAAHELSQIKSKLKDAQKKIESVKKKAASEDKQKQKRIGIKNDKNAKHKRNTKDVIAHVEGVRNTLPEGSSARAALDKHIEKLKSQKPDEDGSFSDIQKKELTAAYSAANRAAKGEKPGATPTKTFFTENKAQAQKKPVLPAGAAAQAGKRFGSTAAEATNQEEAAGAGRLAIQEAVAGISELFSGKRNQKESLSTASSSKEKVKDDTETKKALDQVNLLVKSITAVDNIYSKSEFEEYIDERVTKATPSLMREYYSFLEERVKKSIEELNVG